MKLLRIIVALISLLAFTQSGACSAFAEPVEAPADTVYLPAMTTVDGVPAHADVDYDEMAYEHYDPEWFYTGTDELYDLAEDGDAEGLIALYDRLYAEFVHVDSLSVLAMLEHDADIYDEYWSDEYTYVNELWMEMGDALSVAAAYVLDSACGEAFEEHIGAAAAEDFRSYEAMTEEQIEASDRELELIDEYYELYDTVYDTLTYTYRGQEWTLEQLYGDDGDDLWERDYDGYTSVYYGLQQALTEAFAPIYIELVQIRAQQARDAGYDSYADYAYAEIYGRSYTTEQAQAFCDAVKQVSPKYYEDLYYSDLFYPEDGDIQPAMDSEEILAAMAPYLDRIGGSLLTEPLAYMQEHGLYDLAGAGSGRNDGGYTTLLAEYDAPFIYMTLDGSCYDFISFTHEYGHYCNFYWHSEPNVLTSLDNYDLDEIHSNGLQALYTAFYDEIFTEGADIVEFTNIAYLLENVLDGCVQDEFQRRVFAEPEDLTAEKLNEIYLNVCAEYGMYDDYDETPTWDAGWVWISHTFDSPMYYISYAASAIAALQLWDMAQSDFDAAVQSYLSVLGSGSWDQSYFDVLENAGLCTFAEEGSVKEILTPVLKHLSALDRRYSAGW